MAWPHLSGKTVDNLPPVEACMHVIWYIIWCEKPVLLLLKFIHKRDLSVSVIYYKRKLLNFTTEPIETIMLASNCYRVGWLVILKDHLLEYILIVFYICDRIWEN